MAPRKSAARGDRNNKEALREETARPVAPPTPDAQAQAATEAEATEAEAAEAEAGPAAPTREGGLAYTVRQHIGFVLGFFSVFFTWYMYDDEDPNSVLKMLGCLVVGGVGLVCHEMRPFKRRGYGDVAWDRWTDSLRDRTRAEAGV